MKYIIIGSSIFVYVVKSIIEDVAILCLYKNPNDFKGNTKLKEIEVENWSSYSSPAM